MNVYASGIHNISTEGDAKRFHYYGKMPVDLVLNQ